MAETDEAVDWATYRDIGARFIVANPHPDHDTIATFRRTNKAAFEAAFLEVLLLARETGILKLGLVSIKPAPAKAGGTKSTPVCRKSARYGTIAPRRCAKSWPPTSPN